jgi:two-component system chemotaxis sensor kinase CheA
MDVVKTNLERIGGSIDVVSQPGHGTTFHVKIPLTLAIVAALIVSAGGNRYAVPQANVLELVRVEGGESAGRIERIAGAPVYRLRGELLPLVVLREALGAEPAPLDGTGADNAVTIVVVGSPDRRFGLVVDDVIDTEDIVVKPLSRQLKGIGCYAGATILGDGRVSLILDVWSIASATNVGAVATRAHRGETEATSTRAASLLVTRLRGGRLLAVPLAGVTRLEEVPATQVEPVGHRQALQYRGGILPIVRLDDLVGAGSVPGQRAGGTSDELLRVVVYTERGRSVGLVVDEIVDVTDDVAGFVTDIDGPGVTGTTVVQEQVMELLDIRAAILAADPHFYDGARDRDQTTARA